MPHCGGLSLRARCGAAAVLRARGRTVGERPLRAVCATRRSVSPAAAGRACELGCELDTRVPTAGKTDHFAAALPPAAGEWQTAAAICEEGFSAAGIAPGAFPFALAAAGAWGAAAPISAVDALLGNAEADSKGAARKARRAKSRKGGTRGGIAARQAKAASPAQPRGIAEKPDVLYEDEHMSVLCKPANMLTHPVAGGGGGDKRTLADCALSLLGEKRTSALFGPTARGVAHRLDRGTSGCVAVARHSLAHARLAYLFFEPGVVNKEYVALLQLNDGAAVLSAPGTGELDTPVDRLPARTRYELVATQTGARGGAGVAMLRAWPATGRRHQIRVHAVEGLGAAVIGDEIHGPGPSALPQAVREVLAPHKQGAVHLLHARRLQLPHPLVPRDDEVCCADYDCSSTLPTMVDVEAPFPRHFAEIARNTGLTLCGQTMP